MQLLMASPTEYQSFSVFGCHELLPEGFSFGNVFEFPYVVDLKRSLPRFTVFALIAVEPLITSERLSVQIETFGCSSIPGLLGDGGVRSLRRKTRMTRVFFSPGTVRAYPSSVLSCLAILFTLVLCLFARVLKRLTCHTWASLCMTVFTLNARA